MGVVCVLFGVWVCGVVWVCGGRPVCGGRNLACLCVGTGGARVRASARHVVPTALGLDCQYPRPFNKRLRLVCVAVTVTVWVWGWGCFWVWFSLGPSKH